MSDSDPSSFAAADPKEFAQKVKAASSAQLNELMSGDSRATVLNEIFSRFPTQFRADRAGSTNTVIHWTLTGRPDGGSDIYEVVIADGACTVSSTPQAEPKLTVTLSGVDFLNLLSGNGNPMMMFMTGKLKAKGDLGLASNLANLFDLPKA
jgi:putative sterol carrier protein